MLAFPLIHSSFSFLPVFVHQAAPVKAVGKVEERTVLTFEELPLSLFFR